jgi:hypothetical protein
MGGTVFMWNCMLHQSFKKRHSLPILRKHSNNCPKNNLFSVRLPCDSRWYFSGFLRENRQTMQDKHPTCGMQLRDGTQNLKINGLWRRMMMEVGD